MLIQDLDEESITDEGLIDNIHKIKNNDIDRPNEKLLDDVSIRNENKGKNKGRHGFFFYSSPSQTVEQVT